MPISLDAAADRRDSTREGPPLFDASMLLLLIAVAAFMAAGAHYYSVFDDEAFSCRRYVLPFGEIVRALWNQTEPDPPLYYLLVHGWVRCFGVAPLAMRSLSILFFIGGVAALGAAGRAWYGSRVGRTAMVLAALHPLHLLFGFAARWYSLLFLCVALLLWATARLRERPGPRCGIAWVLAAAAACYTNYFAVVVVGLLVVGCVIRDGRRGLWVMLACIVAAIYSPWSPALFAQLHAFPRASPEATAYVASAARTMVALAAGDLANPGELTTSEPGAWWVWAPMSVFAAAGFLLFLGRRHECGLLAWLCTGCAAAGIGTLTLIDKYVMSFSGPACLLVAVLLTRGGDGRSSESRRWIRPMALAALAVAWAGCYVNLARQRDWTSLRWFDPFGGVVAELSRRMNPSDVLAATHPAVAYNRGLEPTRQPLVAAGTDRLAGWQRGAASVQRPDRALAEGILRNSGVRRVWLIETAATQADAAAQREFVSALSAAFAPTERSECAPDPTAERKDRLDPAYAHPKHRIVVRLFERRF